MDTGGFEAGTGGRLKRLGKDDQSSLDNDALDHLAAEGELMAYRHDSFGSA